MRRHLAAALLVAAVALPVQATTFATDASDLWWNPAENGWGVNVAQQADTLFLTFFVYSPPGNPTWYVASSVSYVGTTNGSVVYSGALYQTDGTWFGSVWNPSAFGFRQVGTVTFSMDSVSTATLAYTVDGVSVSKRIERQTWLFNDISGSYLGATAGTWSGCAVNGYVEEPGTLSITQTISGTTSNAVLTFTYAGGTCTYSGPYTQAGRMGSIAGTYSCSDGTGGSFTGLEIEGNISGVTARGILQSGSCTWFGRIGGLRRGT